jgi:hypothetical protein
MYQCYSNVRTFMMNTIKMLIDNLNSVHQAKLASESQNGLSPPAVGNRPQVQYSEQKHVVLLKTLYGMCDEMLSKNFLEDKRTN